MQGMFSKLSSYAALIGVVGAIGGGFMAWGEFNNRIAQLENKEFVVNETVDLTDVNDKIVAGNKEAMEAISSLAAAIERLKVDIAVNQAGIQFNAIQIEEVEAANSNPLVN
jgi:NAD(P)-dependent dehydrogenase (short-subunit alcohol dehydrogenase family)|tara:strand:+ start:1567 stop:1899 length:333 start_codon:yes stop_codon:yes gene_type:complete